MNFLLPIPILLVITSLTWAAGQELIPALDTTNPSTLQEANRVLEDELKLAARPQPYVLIDLEAKAILIKSRGIELHRLPIENWSASHVSNSMSTYRLRERPPIARRKLDPAAGSDQDPIALADMPTTYTLQFSPPLTIVVFSTSNGNLWRWATQLGRIWWDRFMAWSNMLQTGVDPPASPALQLAVSVDHAQSFAWTLTQDMPFLIRRTSVP